MTPKKVPGPDARDQALAILKHLSNYLTGAPDRRVTITFGADGWRVALDESRRTSGHSIADALSQACTVISFDGVTP
jgi:hypothetical protein